MPTLAQVITKINSDITANGNEEITGLVLNSVLLDIVAQINDLTGQLEDLNTDDVTSIVNAINSLKQELDDFINSQTGALVGAANPNEETPVGFDGRVGTIYLKMVTVGVQTTPESYWIYTGINDIGWLNLTADDTFKMVIVDHYEDLPAQGQTNRIYFVQDENNTYIWNVNIFPNDYVLVGGVINGEYIDDTTFNDEFGSPVVPDTGNLYLDTVTGKYYRWDGNYFLPIDQDTGGGNLTLEQARQNGNVLEGDVVIENFSSGQNETGFISEGGSSKILFNDEDGAEISNLAGNAKSYMYVYTNLALLGINDNDLGRYISIGANLKGGEYLIEINAPSNATTKGLIGSQEFDKQGDRKAFAQIADVEDAISTIDFSDLTNNVIPKKSPGGNELEDSKATETTTGISVGGDVRGKGFIGRSVSANIASSYAIELNDIAEHYILTMTDNTSISFSNMISDSESVVITLTVTGNFSMTLPAFLKASPNNDSYLGTENNEIVINIKKGGLSPVGYYTLTNIAP